MKRIVFSLIAISMFGLMAQANAAVGGYWDKSYWVSDAGSYSTEDFADSTLNAGVSVVSDSGYVIGGEWVDFVGLDSDMNASLTTFSFSSAINAFGADWDFGGEITGFVVTLNLVNGDAVHYFGNSDHLWNNGFWGVVSDIAFTSVSINAVSQQYSMDNMVYSTLSASPVPVPAAVWLFGSGLLGLMGVRRRRA